MGCFRTRKAGGKTREMVGQGEMLSPSIEEGNGRQLVFESYQRF